MNISNKKNRGYIALVSIILLSSILSLCIIALNAYCQSLEATTAEDIHTYQSFEDAISCASIAIQYLSEKNIPQQKIIALRSSRSCTIESITALPGIIHITTSATSSFHSYAHVETDINPETLEIIAQQEY